MGCRVLSASICTYRPIEQYCKAEIWWRQYLKSVRSGAHPMLKLHDSDGWGMISLYSCDASTLSVRGLQRSGFWVHHLLLQAFAGLVDGQHKETNRQLCMCKVDWTLKTTAAATPCFLFGFSRVWLALWLHTVRTSSDTQQAPVRGPTND